MSKKRQQPTNRVLVRSFAIRHTVDHEIGAHAHDWHQLVYASEGVLWVHTAHGDWVVPPNRAVWVPAGVRHGIEMSGPVLVQTLYFVPDVSDALPDHCCAVNVSGLLRELIRHTITIGMLDESNPAHSRLIGVLLDQLAVMTAIPLQLPWPVDERAQRAAGWLRDHPDDSGAIRQMARKASMSARTLERLFRKETGLTFGRWRQQLRLLQALRLLAAGRSVTAAALGVGYDSPSAFISMFRRTLGVTPFRYFDSEARRPNRTSR